MREEAGFWLTVMLVAVAGVALFKIVALRVGARVPGLAELGSFI